MGERPGGSAAYEYPHTIENGAGECLTFSRRIPGPAGDRLEGDTVVAPGAGPPMHVHHLEAEGFTVVTGRLGYELGGDPSPRYAGPGESVMFPPGQPHRFWNAGDSELRCTAWVEPAYNVEYLLTELFASARRRGTTGRPDPFDAAFLMWRYRREYRLLVLPPIVEWVAFPLLVLIGRALGRYRKYADAPEPVGARAATGTRRVADPPP